MLGFRHALALLLLALALHEHKVEANVSLYSVGEYSLYNALVNLGSSYTYYRDTATLTYAGTDSFTLVIYAHRVAFSNFAALDSQINSTYLSGAQMQVPLYGSGLVHSYNLPNVTLPAPLVLDGETLGRIWTGNITHWDDSAIANLNGVVVLPHEPIILCYGSPGIADFFLVNNISFPTSESVSETFKRGMSALSPRFTEELTRLNGSFMGMTPFAEGRGFTGSNSTTRLAFVQARPYSLTYSDLATATAMQAVMARMVNKAGTTLKPTAASIQSAMEDFQTALLQDDDLLIPLFDGEGPDSWPLSYVATVVINRVGGADEDCSVAQELVRFLSWLQVNQRAIDRASALGWAPLSVAFKKKVIDVLGTVECEDEPALTTAYVMAEGIDRAALTDMASNYGSNTFLQKFFIGDVASAVRDISQGAVDLALVTSGATLEEVDVDGVTIIPVLGSAAIPCYNIPELTYMTPPLNLTLELWAAIYLNEVKLWNDPRIVAINPEYASLLTNRSITVVVGTDPSPLTRTVTRALSSISANFSSMVGVVDQPNYPVQLVANRTVGFAGTESTIAPRMNTVPYSFSVLTSGTTATTKSVRMAALLNSAGKFIAPSTTSVESAMRNFADPSTEQLFEGALFASGAESYPVTLYDSFVVPESATDCTKAAAVVDWIYWTQSSSKARRIAVRNGVAQAANVPALSKRILLALANVTCNGRKVSSIANCVDPSSGLLCSDRGACYDNKCTCNDSWSGNYCQTAASSSGSSDVVLIATLSSIIPAAVILVIVMIVAAVAIVVARRRERRDEWEIDTDELEMAELLGTGGYGEVYRAKWRGTEVAVKLMVAKDGQVTKEMQRNFADEVRVMTALRHPNVVLFMAASTTPPKLCIVMEFMGLGSLYDLLHNELMPSIPIALKSKMAYQAAKGMHFLHSSGIVHRDLKSLNLLLDSKWNVKVSDFGLTQFREGMKKVNQTALQGSIHWTAPEVLNENPDVDYVLADVYSFGIILWELATRQQPFAGMSPAAVAVAVIRDNLRPLVPDFHEDDEDQEMTSEYRELLVSCWHPDPTIRPAFLEIMTRLSSMVGDSNSNNSSFTSKTSSSASTTPKAGSDGSWTLQSASGSSHSSNGSDRSREHSAKWAHHEGVAAAGGATRAPEGEVTIVFSDITRAASLWEFNPAAMKDATLIHNETLRSLLKEHSGYEVMFVRDRNSGEGSFCVAFQRTEDALKWCMASQQALVQVEWPASLLEHPGAAEEWGDTDDRVLFRGPRVRMGVHVGVPKVVRDPMTRRVEFIGPVVNTAARITALTHGGQILVSGHAVQRVLNTELIQEKNRLKCLGKFEMPDSDPNGVKLYELRSKGLEARFFGGVSKNNHFNSIRAARMNDTGELSAISSSSSSASGDVAQTAVGEGMMFQEDNFLTSANLCRWVLDYNEITIGKQIGMGSYGVVYRGKWKGIEVAAKRFIKQKLDERRMLEFRAEMAFLSELHHPNIVLFIGACVKRPNLCIVTEFVKQGALKEILINNSIKLTWQQKLGLLRSAALGINYLHSLHPVIVHRDLKPSNLLVDENWNVKVADFGFARIKEENATMTRCGTPCWTAPEVIRGEKYSEKADVFSFGIMMWEVLTRKQPYAGRNFMNVSLDVLDGRRPQIPADTPGEFEKMMKSCWHMAADKRPTMEEVISTLDALLDSPRDLSPV